jgi:sigma-E factor negative regulatory protein RseA
MNEAIKMQLSAFVDGELPQNEAELLLRRLCQDADLRQQAAEYMAMGRVMRGERSVVGMAKLRQRIAATIDDKELQQEFAATKVAAPKFVRPLAGVAIAASVALAALLGLQQMSEVPNQPDASRQTVAGAEVDSYTVPVRDDDPLRDYYLSHSASASYIGADSINARLVTMEIRQNLDVDTQTDDVIEETAEDAEPDAATETSTP